MTEHIRTPAPGWYPAPHAGGEKRYWDGAHWTEPPGAGPARNGVRPWVWGVLAGVVLIVVAAIIGLTASQGLAGY
jgi:hypothetical protein